MGEIARTGKRCRPAGEMARCVPRGDEERCKPPGDCNGCGFVGEGARCSPTQGSGAIGAKAHCGAICWPVWWKPAAVERHCAACAAAGFVTTETPTPGEAAREGEAAGAGETARCGNKGEESDCCHIQAELAAGGHTSG